MDPNVLLVSLIFLLLVLRFFMDNNQNFFKKVPTPITRKLQHLKSYINILNSKFCYTDEDDAKFFVNRIISLCLIAAIAFLIDIYSVIIPGIFDRNFDAPLKSNISFVTILVFMFLLMIVAGMLQKIEIARIALPSIAIFFSIYFIQNNYSILGCFNYMILFFIIGVLYLYINKGHRPNLWIYFTIFIMLLLLFGGIYLIDAVYGYNNAKFKLPTWSLVNENGVNTNNLTCSSPQGTRIIVGNQLNCSISPSLSNITQLEANITVKTIFEDKKSFKMDLAVGTDNTFLFTPQSDVAYLGSSISYKDVNGRTVYLSTDILYYYKFYTKEDEQNFMTSSIVLLGVILFSVPSMMVNFRKLSKQGEEKYKTYDYFKN